MKHIKLFEDLYSALPDISKETVEKMSMDEIFAYLSKLGMKKNWGEMDSILHMKVNQDPSLENNMDFVKRIGQFMEKFPEYETDIIPGSPEYARSKQDERTIQEVESLTQEEIFKRIRLGKFVKGTAAWTGLMGWLGKNPEVAVMFYQLEKLFKKGDLHYVLPDAPTSHGSKNAWN